jgi:DNA-binding response OmpR family regulator
MSTHLQSIRAAAYRPSYDELAIQLAEAREEIRQLRETITPVVALPSFLSLHRKQQALVLTLYRAAPAIVPHSRLMEIVYPDGDEPSDGHVTRMIWLCRKSLRAHGMDIKTEYGIGRYMPSQSAAILRGLISQQAVP